MEAGDRGAARVREAAGERRGEGSEEAEAAVEGGGVASWTMRDRHRSSRHSSSRIMSAGR